MKYLDYDIRPMTEQDLDQVLAIEAVSFINPWKREDFLYELNENPVSNLFVIELSNASLNLKCVCGFFDYWHTFDSGTLCQIAVHPDIRREHLATMMMEEIVSDAKAKKIRTLTLEVRKSNEAAIKLYEKFNFKYSHIKPGYYSDGEDAIYMILEVQNG